MTILKFNRLEEVIYAISGMMKILAAAAFYRVEARRPPAPAAAITDVSMATGMAAAFPQLVTRTRSMPNRH